MNVCAKKSKKNDSISVITATFNSGKHIINLIRSLNDQTDLDFTWIVVDGASTDGTIKIIKDNYNGVLCVLSESDFGIYHALNKSIALNNSEYYLVVGSDDVLDCDAILNYRNSISRSNFAELICARITYDGKTTSLKKNLGWLLGIMGVASSHSLGLLFKASLHDAHGLYSKRLPIGADQLFILNAIRGGATIYRANFIAGHFSTKGTSGLDHLGVITELFRAQVYSGSSFWLQFVIVLFRLIKFGLIHHGLFKRSP
jgi:glycosyltransferase involved in cell wall biosynthesis